MPFSDIAGHDRIIEVFKRSLRSGKMAHSYIFEGIQGCGRKKTALAFIQALFCEIGSDDACGVCSSCRKVASGNHADIHTLEPLPDKRDISVDQIRDFQRELNLRPYEAPRKACLIEPADRMNTNSANSLLKTLEEPPGNAIIILLTENADMLLQTIRSRCQLVHFAPLSPETINSLLLKQGTEPSKADLLATMAEGSMQRALERDNDDLLEKQKLVFERMMNVRSDSIATVFDASEELSGNREETVQTLDIMISFARDLVYLATGENRIINSGFKQTLQQRASSLSLKHAVELLDTILETRRAVQRNANNKLALDCLHIKLAEILSN